VPRLRFRSLPPVVAASRRALYHLFFCVSNFHGIPSYYTRWVLLFISTGQARRDWGFVPYRVLKLRPPAQPSLPFIFLCISLHRIPSHYTRWVVLFISIYFYRLNVPRLSPCFWPRLEAKTTRQPISTVWVFGVSILMAYPHATPAEFCVCVCIYISCRTTHTIIAERRAEKQCQRRGANSNQKTRRGIEGERPGRRRYREVLLPFFHRRSALK